MTTKRKPIIASIIFLQLLIIIWIYLKESGYDTFSYAVGKMLVPISIMLIILNILYSKTHLRYYKTQDEIIQELRIKLKDDELLIEHKETGRIERIMFDNWTEIITHGGEGNFNVINKEQE